jgi:uncharacterized protein YbjT (DUF2867 family)
MTTTDKQVLIFGATGNMGGAAARELLARGWQVRAVSRSPQGEKAQALAALGAELVKADMDDRGSLDAAFDGMTRVFSVQNWSTSGVDGEIRQGKLVANAARAAGVTHLVYGSAGMGEPNSGIPHFDCKVVVEEYMRSLDLPFTIVRPMPFMELMSQKEYYPAMAAWGAMPKVLGWDTPLPWVAVHDIGVAVANIFADSDRWIGREVLLCGDMCSLREARAAFQAVTGKKPRGVPLPMALFQRMAGEELVQMWHWLDRDIAERGQDQYMTLLDATREVCPEAHDVAGWLRLQAQWAE